MRTLRHPVTQFLLASILTILALLLVSHRLAQQAAEDEALAEARTLNAVLARSVAEPSVTRGLVDGEAGAIDRFDRQVVARLLVGDVRRVNIWDESGRVVYSNAFRLIGASFPLDDCRRTVLRDGGTGVERSDPEDPENRAAQGSPGQEPDDTGEQVRLFTRVPGPEGRGPLLFEGYYTFTDIEERREEIYASFRWITVGGPLGLVLVVTPMLWVLARRLTLSAKEREQLLRSSLDASDAERRRIARDLHDGVVQDLAGTAYSVSAVSRDPAVPAQARGRLEVAGATLRDGLRSLRSLQAEIHPPDLHVEGLAAALEDLTAPAQAAGVEATVSVVGADDATDTQAALVWRVAQEAVRNALRHARATTVTVRVQGDSDVLSLEVVDDGIGFDPRQRPRDGSFGLRGLRSLVAEAGGTLDVRSSAGGGTTVRVEVTAR